MGRYQHLSDSLKDLLLFMLKSDPQARLTSEQVILQHPQHPVFSPACYGLRDCGNFTPILAVAYMSRAHCLHLCCTCKASKQRLVLGRGLAHAFCQHCACGPSWTAWSSLAHVTGAAASVGGCMRRRNLAAAVAQRSTRSSQHGSRPALQALGAWHCCRHVHAAAAEGQAACAR